MRPLFVLSLTACLIACSNPHNVVLPADIESMAGDEKLQRALTKLPEEEKALVGAYLIRTGLAQAFGGAGIPPGTTVKDAIANQRSWVAEQARAEAEATALAEKVRKEREANTRAMNEVLTVAVTHLKLQPSNYRQKIYSDYFAVSTAFDNKSKKALAGVKGVMVVSDIFGETIKRIRLSYDKGVEAGSTAVWNGTVDHNQFMDEDKKLASTPFEKLRFSWEPEIYLFADGSKMTAGE